MTSSIKSLPWIFLSAALSVRAATITGASAGGAPVTQGLYTVSLTPRPVQYLGAGSDIAYGDLNVLRAKFNDTTEWLFNASGGTATGTFNVLQYDPWIAGNKGGANFTVIYDDASAMPRSDYNWVQIAHPHNWGTFGSTTHVDSKFNNVPFYANYTPQNLPTITTSPGLPNTGEIWLNAADYPTQHIQNPVGRGKVPAGDLIFNDQPYCLLTCADLDGHAYDYFDLFLVTFTWNGKFGNQSGGTVSLMDGMRWGVEITKSPETPSDPGKLPEPSTWSMIAGGGTMLLVARRRRHA